jgi:hypothetical protein
MAPHVGGIGAHNRRVVQADSVAMGLVNSAGPFLSVFLVRLGATATQIGLLTALPGITAVVLAIPIGRWLQRAKNIVPWWSGARLAGQVVYVAIAAAAVLTPRDWIIDVVLVLWAASTIPGILGQVAFPIVMDGAAGAGGRYELLSRRWSIMGLVTAVTVVLVGQALGLVMFPINYAAFFAVVFGAALASYWFAHQIDIPDQAPVADGGGAAAWLRIRGLVEVLRPEPSFLRFEVREFVTSAGIGLLAPLLPLFYVEEVHAPDQWIGIIVAAQSAGALTGYLVARRVARRRGGNAVLISALAAAALVPLALALVQNVEVAAAMSFVNGVAAAAVNLALFDELMRRVPPRYGVTFSAVDQSAQNLALTIGPLSGGVLAAGIGIRAALVAAAALAAVGCGLFSFDRWARRHDQSSG